jgi:ectoine hydroxylase-related dioxygenase (phytanoyl-CoA dioxygenase family)
MAMARSMTFSLSPLRALGAAEVKRFREDGFLVIENVLDEEQLEALRASLPRLFAGDFETGVYPDEWYWREGMSLPDVTRHMANAWKADLSVAKLVLSADIGRAAAKLSGWTGVRLGQDTIWWKPPKTKAVSFHQDTSYMDFLDPPRTITCWTVLDQTHRDAGTLEYVRGSHRWPLTKIPEGFHAPDDHRALMKRAANAAGEASPTTVPIEVPAGSCVFHCGETWHGSGPNVTSGTTRRSIGAHLLQADARFSDRDGGYIYRRYQRTGDPTLDESYFPILWTDDGRRTDWIESYCLTGRRE